MGRNRLPAGAWDAIRAGFACFAPAPKVALNHFGALDKRCAQTVLVAAELHGACAWHLADLTFLSGQGFAQGFGAAASRLSALIAVCTVVARVSVWCPDLLVYASTTHRKTRFLRFFATLRGFCHAIP